jgi:starch synthase (maltosyl-transferring)
MVKRINKIRRENPALQQLSNITFLDTANEALIAYAKRAGPNTVITVVNIDPFQPQEGLAVIPAELGLPPSFTVSDLLHEQGFQWRIGPNYVRLDAGQSHIARVEQ